MGSLDVSNCIFKDNIIILDTQAQIYTAVTGQSAWNSQTVNNITTIELAYGFGSYFGAIKINANCTCYIRNKDDYTQSVIMYQPSN